MVKGKLVYAQATVCVRKKTWRTVVNEGVMVVEQGRMEEATDRRARRKVKTLGSTKLVSKSCGKD